MQLMSDDSITRRCVAGAARLHNVEDGYAEHGGHVTLLQLEARVQAQEEDVHV
jgi:hypothetical protein